MKSSSSRNVVLVALPPGLIEYLPHEDQRALRDVVGKSVILNGYDEDGGAELELAISRACGISFTSSRDS